MKCGRRAEGFLAPEFIKQLGLSIRLLKNAHLRRFPHPSSLRRTPKYASLRRISGALHLCIFDQPGKNSFFNNLLADPGFFPHFLHDLLSHFFAAVCACLKGSGNHFRCLAQLPRALLDGLKVGHHVVE